MARGLPDILSRLLSRMSRGPGGMGPKEDTGTEKTSILDFFKGQIRGAGQSKIADPNNAQAYSKLLDAGAAGMAAITAEAKNAIRQMGTAGLRQQATAATPLPMPPELQTAGQGFSREQKAKFRSYKRIMRRMRRDPGSMESWAADMQRQENDRGIQSLGPATPRVRNIRDWHMLGMGAGTPGTRQSNRATMWGPQTNQPTGAAPGAAQPAAPPAKSWIANAADLFKQWRDKSKARTAEMAQLSIPVNEQVRGWSDEQREQRLLKSPYGALLTPAMTAKRMKLPEGTDVTKGQQIEASEAAEQETRDKRKQELGGVMGQITQAGAILGGPAGTAVTLAGSAIGAVFALKRFADSINDANAEMKLYSARIAISQAQLEWQQRLATSQVALGTGRSAEALADSMASLERETVQLRIDTGNATNYAATWGVRYLQAMATNTETVMDVLKRMLAVFVKIEDNTDKDQGGLGVIDQFARLRGQWWKEPMVPFNKGVQGAGEFGGKAGNK